DGRPPDSRRRRSPCRPVATGRRARARRHRRRGSQYGRDAAGCREDRRCRRRCCPGRTADRLGRSLRRATTPACIAPADFRVRSVAIRGRNANSFCCRPAAFPFPSWRDTVGPGKAPEEAMVALERQVAAEPPVLELRGLSKSYGATEVLRALDLARAAGEFLVLVGPSGCGKSTLLNCIAGLDESSGGEIRIGGRDVTKVPPRDRDIAMVFQSYALYPTM